MKKQKRFYFELFTLILLSSCTSRPDPIAVEIIPPEIIQFESSIQPEIILPEIVPVNPLIFIIEQVKLNENDIEKYFILDQSGNIIVKADIKDSTGDFEIIYYLTEAKTLENSLYEVQFTARNTKTEEIMDDVLVWKPIAGDAGILLSFDDSYVDRWTEYLYLFDIYRAKVTFFLMGEFNPFSHLALERGHDVGYHSLNHLDLRTLSAESFERETSEGAQLFREEGVPVLSFAYPYGFSSPWMNEALLQTFSVLRGYGVTFRIYNKNEINSSYVSSRAIDNTVIREENDFNRIITSMLRTVKFLDGNWVLPLTTHDISDAAWAIRPHRLEFVLGLAVELKLKFYRFSDFSEP